MERDKEQQDGNQMREYFYRCPNCRLTLIHLHIMTFPAVDCYRCEKCGYHKDVENVERLILDFPFEKSSA